MGWKGYCSGPMARLFDAASSGDRLAQRQAIDVCRQCPIQRQCRRDYVDQPLWTGNTAPTGVIAGVVVSGKHTHRMEGVPT